MIIWYIYNKSRHGTNSFVPVSMSSDTGLGEGEWAAMGEGEGGVNVRRYVLYKNDIITRIHNTIPIYVYICKCVTMHTFGYIYYPVYICVYITMYTAVYT